MMVGLLLNSSLYPSLHFPIFISDFEYEDENILKALDPKHQKMPPLHTQNTNHE